MKLEPKYINTIFQISAMLILFAAVTYLFYAPVAKYAIILGVVGYAITTFTNRYKGESLRGKRLFNMQVFAVLFMVASAYLMFVDMMQWVVTLLIAAILLLYSTIMLARVHKQDQNNK